MPKAGRAAMTNRRELRISAITRPDLAQSRPRRHFYPLLQALCHVCYNGGYIVDCETDFTMYLK